MRTGLGFGAHGEPSLLTKYHQIKGALSTQNPFTPGTYHHVQFGTEVRTQKTARTSRYIRQCVNSQNYNGSERWSDTRSLFARQRREFTAQGKALREAIRNALKSRDEYYARVALDVARRTTGHSRPIHSIVAEYLKAHDFPVFTCACCSTWSLGTQYESLHDGRYYCSRCVENGRAREVTYGPEEGRYTTGGDAYDFGIIIDGDVNDIDRYVVTANFVSENRLVYDSRTDIYVSRQDWELLRGAPERPGTRVYDYHCGPNLGHIPSEFDKRTPRVLLGMELEVEVYDAEDDDSPDIECTAEAVLKAPQAVIANYVKAERDGSLDHGFEMITGYTGLDVHARMLKIMTEQPAWRDLRSHDTSTCGLHVHLDRKDMSPLHVTKFQKFINSKENAPLMRCISRRYGASYARFHTDTDWGRTLPHAIVERARNDSAWGSRTLQSALKTRINPGNVCSEEQGQRYSALNWQNEYTVEMRMFKGTTKYSTIMACLEFAYASWQFARLYPLNQMTSEKFMEYICAVPNRKDTKFLRAYLQAKRFQQFYTQEVIVRPKDKRVTMCEPLPSPNTRDLERDMDVVMLPDDIREHAMRVWPAAHAARVAERERANNRARDANMVASARGTGMGGVVTTNGIPGIYTYTTTY